MKKWLLTLVITGVLGSGVTNAAAIDSGKKVMKADKAKPVKKNKKKKYTNKIVKKTKRSGNKF
jgi:hypothetical protein